jgi:hypothetical protein
MGKNKTAAVSPKPMRRNTDILAAPLGESWRDAVTNLGISQKEAWKAKQAKDREERALINAKKRQGMLEENKAIEKKPASPKKSPKKEAGKKMSKTARIFPFKELPAEIRDLISSTLWSSATTRSQRSSKPFVLSRSCTRQLLTFITRSITSLWASSKTALSARISRAASTSSS